MTLSHIYVPLSLLLLVSLFLSPANAQSQSGLVQSDTASLNRLLRSSIDAAADSIERRIESQIDRFQKKNACVADSVSVILRVSAERLISEAGDSLSPQRRDTLRNLDRTLEKALASHAIDLRRSGDDSLRKYQKSVLMIERKYSNCNDCENSEDVQSIHDEYLDGADSLAEILHQSLEDLTETIGDSLDVFRDRLADASSDMIDRQRDENEYTAAHSSRFIATGSYTSDVVYRGRDGGVKQYALSPELAYKDHSGLFVDGSAAWLGNSLNGWDQRDISGGYEFELGTHFAGALSYTHYWFADSSRLEKADLKNSIDAELSLLTNPVNIYISPSLAFTTASEFTTEFSLSHEFDVDRFLRRADLSIEPTVTAIVGEQNASLTQKRLKRAAVKKRESGDSCSKCSENQELLRNSGLRICGAVRGRI